MLSLIKFGVKPQINVSHTFLLQPDEFDIRIQNEHSNDVNYHYYFYHYYYYY